jgi:hypothetical protein
MALSKFVRERTIYHTERYTRSVFDLVRSIMRDVGYVDEDATAEGLVNYLEPNRTLKTQHHVAFTESEIRENACHFVEDARIVTNFTLEILRRKDVGSESFKREHLRYQLLLQKLLTDVRRFWKKYHQPQSSAKK